MGVSIIFNNLFTDFLMFSIFRAYLFLIDGFRQEPTENWWRGSRMPWDMGNIFHSGVWLESLSFTEFLNTGAGLSACLSTESTPFGKKWKCSSHSSESFWLDRAVSLAQKAQEMTVKSQPVPLRPSLAMKMLCLSDCAWKCKSCWTFQ